MTQEITRNFNQFKKKQQWSQMGAMFFNAFVTLPDKSPARKCAERLWDSLTEKEKDLCESR